MMTLLKTRDFSLLVIGQLLSKIGDSLFFPALLWYVQSKTGSTVALALTGVGLTLPPVFSAVIGVYVDRWNRLRTMITCDVIRFCIILCLLLISYNSNYHVTYIVILIGFNQLFGQLFALAAASFIPSIVTVRQLPEANGLLTSIAQGATLIGFGLGGVVIDRSSPEVLFAANAASFAISALLLMLIRYPTTEQSREVQQSFLIEMLAGTQFIWSQILLRYAILFLFLGNLSFAPFELLLTNWTNSIMNTTAAVYGLYLSFMSLGTLLGGLMIQPLAKLVRVPKLMVVGLLGQGITILSFSLFTPVWFGALTLLIFGACNACFGAAFNSWLQQITPPNLRGRVFGTLQTLIMAGQPAGMALYGLLGRNMDTKTIFLCLSGIALVVGSGLWLVQVALQHPITQRDQNLTTQDGIR